MQKWLSYISAATGPTKKYYTCTINTGSYKGISITGNQEETKI
jgi:hypothetical protein